MTRDDISRMAREAGMFWFDYGCNDGSANMLEKFAALVAAAEREACAEVCENLPTAFKVAAYEFGYQANEPHAKNYAAAIRARGET
jgi:hypothetical protein